MTEPRASLGTFGARLGAWVIDAVPYMVGPYAVAQAGGNWLLSALTFVVIGAVWTVLPEARTGASPGKFLLGLRTLDIDAAQPIGVSRSIIRWFVKYVVCSVLPVGYLWFFRSPTRQTFADLAARTVVVHPLPPQ